MREFFGSVSSLKIWDEIEQQFYKIIRAEENENRSDAELEFFPRGDLLISYPGLQTLKMHTQRKKKNIFSTKSCGEHISN